MRQWFLIVMAASLVALFAWLHRGTLLPAAGPAAPTPAATTTTISYLGQKEQAKIIGFVNLKAMCAKDSRFEHHCSGLRRFAYLRDGEALVARAPVSAQGAFQMRVQLTIGASYMLSVRVSYHGLVRQSQTNAISTATPKQTFYALVVA